ncbi:MAG: bifunctional diaminohydroxyphosphoribosylaminopyrimidine deaminase/5-amino-6-(5-phosphoribosylamino)uracil reductase RibD [Peptoniphilus grossensis]|uniref:bifunctional diaminohydroxyphosphoribosylaminopyrimidine deaminase/5-amino-6-(5-phosphoribosylamino)uracil reductase RibD n=1 Tax=Peptoniphilus grossensis TaxID=1465756 RepID=UPI0025837E11|nr:bifunctional diaminohydroxyphosphoribosylaminopyrimidine deaminase/5-amino-6-(5-phosphoribosylamino)uracil reductase RibD [Peptoniphilus grossensis]MDU5100153.1 bifunctional diaminohydroxyphosphoribosylaminopyrimidine deaminase/5-amino-6-(5-phosphoribosylamino)uracil reductase RibD [Peptoniphilus grossensis]
MYVENFNDSFYMLRALELAEKGIGHTKTNPLVGCVIVKDEEIIGEGAHLKFGENHAEVNAIEDAKNRGNDLKGASLYVNLEPCSHYGKTPPCANRIVEEGITRVVIGTTDPFPKVAGGGIKILEDAGISITEGVCQEECLKLNERFFTYVKNKRPFVVLKAGMSLDGKIATASGESKWITSEFSRAYSHELRGKLDAIMVGIGTVLADNPTLNVRHGKYRVNPIRIVTDSKLRIPLDAKLLAEDLDSIAIIATTKNCDKEKLEKLKKMKNVEVLIFGEKNGKVDLKDLMEKLKAYDISSILLEGGRTLNAEMLKNNLVDKFYFFMAPILLGSKGIPALGDLEIDTLKDAIKIKDMKCEKLFDDILVTGRCD